MGYAERIAERLPDLLRSGPHGEPAVLRAERLVRRARLVRGAEGLRNFTRGEVPPRLPDGEGDAGLEKADIDERSAPGPLAGVERGHRRERAVQRAGQIRDGDADLHRASAAFGPRDRHEPAHPLGHDVEARSIRVWPVLAPARSGDVDEAGIERRELRIVDAQ